MKIVHTLRDERNEHLSRPAHLHDHNTPWTREIHIKLSDTNFGIMEKQNTNTAPTSPHPVLSNPNHNLA